MIVHLCTPKQTQNCIEEGHIAGSTGQHGPSESEDCGLGRMSKYGPGWAEKSREGNRGDSPQHSATNHSNERMSGPVLSVLKRCVPKTLAFAFGLRSRSKTRCFKTRVLGRRLPNGKPQERLRFRELRSKTLAFKKRIAIVFCDLKTSLGARACV